MKHIVEVVKTLGVGSCLTNLAFRSIDLNDKRVACTCLGDALDHGVVSARSESQLAVFDLMSIDIKAIVGSAFDLDRAFGKRAVGEGEACKRDREAVGIRRNDAIVAAHAILDGFKVSMNVEQ